MTEIVKSMPMTWATAYRLVANELGVSAAQFEAWVAETAEMPEAERELWLSDTMYRAARKRMMVVAGFEMTRDGLGGSASKCAQRAANPDREGVVEEAAPAE